MKISTLPYKHHAAMYLIELYSLFNMCNWTRDIIPPNIYHSIVRHGRNSRPMHKEYNVTLLFNYIKVDLPVAITATQHRWEGQEVDLLKVIKLWLTELVNAGAECGFGNSADDGIFLLAVVENHDGRDASDAVVGCNGGAGVCVHLVAVQLPCILLC